MLGSQSEGAHLEDKDLIGYISESCTLSKALEEYGDRKSTSTTTARRLADFLGDSMVKDKGLSCQYIVAKYPEVNPFRAREGAREAGVDLTQGALLPVHRGQVPRGLPPPPSHPLASRLGQTGLTPSGHASSAWL